MVISCVGWPELSRFVLFYFIFCSEFQPPEDPSSAYYSASELSEIEIVLNSINIHIAMIQTKKTKQKKAFTGFK